MISIASAQEDHQLSSLSGVSAKPALVGIGVAVAVTVAPAPAVAPATAPAAAAGSTLT